MVRRIAAEPTPPNDDAEGVTTDNTAAPPPSGPPGGASFEQLEAQAIELEAFPGDAAPSGDPQAEGQAMTNAAAVAGMACAIRDTVCMVAGLESPARTFPDEKAEKLGAIWGPVLDHYGINLSAAAGKYAVLMVAAVQTLPLLKDTVVEAKKEIDAKDAARKQLPPPPPAPKPAAVGEPVAASPTSFTPGQIKPTFQQ